MIVNAQPASCKLQYIQCAHTFAKLSWMASQLWSGLETTPARPHLSLAFTALDRSVHPLHRTLLYVKGRLPQQWSASPPKSPLQCLPPTSYGSERSVFFYWRIHIKHPPWSECPPPCTGLIRNVARAHLCWSTIVDTAIYWENVTATFFQSEFELPVGTKWRPACSYGLLVIHSHKSTKSFLGYVLFQVV